MAVDFFASLNYIAVLVTATIYFVLGALWFAPFLFGEIWRKELKKHNVIIEEPKSSDMMLKMGLTFLGNIITVLAIAYFVFIVDATTLIDGFSLGFLIAVGFTMTSVGIVYTWQSRSIKLFLIDVGYPAVGIVATAMLLSVWL